MWLHIRPDNTSTDCFTLLHKIPLPSLSFCCWTPHYYCHHHHNFIVVVFMWVCAFVDCCLWCSLIWSCCSSVILWGNPDARTITVTVYLLYSVILLDYYYWSTTSTSWLTTTTEVLLGVCYCWCCIAFYFIFIFGSLFFSGFNFSFQIAVNNNLEPTWWYKVVAVSYKKRLAVTRVGAWCNIRFLCGRWSPGESCFIFLKYCVLASCLTSKAPET